MNHQSASSRQQAADSLYDAGLRQTLRDEIDVAKHRLRFSIQQVAAATGASVAQIRSWDALLKPVRLGAEPEVGMDVSARKGEHRRYDWLQLETVLLMTHLLRSGMSSEEVAQLLAKHPDLHDIVFSPTTAVRDALPGAAGHRPDRFDQSVEERAIAAEHDGVELLERHITARVLRLIMTLLVGARTTTEVYLVIPLHPIHINDSGDLEIPVPHLTSLGMCAVGALHPPDMFTAFVHPHPDVLQKRNYECVPLHVPTTGPRSDQQERVLSQGAQREPAPKNADTILAYLVMQKRPPYAAAPLGVGNPTARERAVAVALKLLIWLRETGLLSALNQDRALDLAAFPIGGLSDHQLHALLRRFADWIVGFGDTGAAASAHEAGSGHEVTLHVTPVMEREQQPSCWHFSVLLVPQDRSPARQYQRLVILAQSSHSQHDSSDVILTLGAEPGLSFRAYVNGTTALRRWIAPLDPSIANREQEPMTQSAVAVPLEGLNGLPEGVLYVASEQTDAFSDTDVLALRLLGRVVAELLALRRLGQAAVLHLPEAAAKPHAIDFTVASFETEDAFIGDLIRFLQPYVVAAGNHTHQRGGASSEPTWGSDTVRPLDDGRIIDETALALIALDVDGTGEVAERLGEAAAANLTRAIGERTHSWILTQRSRPERIRLYRVYGDRFYLWLRDIPAAKVEELASRLWRTLGMRYLITTRMPMARDSSSPARYVDPGPVTVRLGVNCYTHRDLLKLAQGDPDTISLSTKVVSQLAEALKMGRHQGGNCIVAWDPKQRRLKVLSQDTPMGSQGQGHSEPRNAGGGTLPAATLVEEDERVPEEPSNP